MKKYFTMFLFLKLSDISIRVCNKWDSFVSRLKLLLDKLIEKGAKKKRLLMTLSKYFKNKAETKRFDISHHEIQANILVFILDRL